MKSQSPSHLPLKLRLQLNRLQAKPLRPENRRLVSPLLANRPPESPLLAVSRLLARRRWLRRMALHHRLPQLLRQLPPLPPSPRTSPTRSRVVSPRR